MSVRGVSTEDLWRLVDRGPFGLAIIDERDVIGVANTTLMNWLGFGRDELLGRAFPSVLAPGDRIYFDTHIRPLLHVQDRVRELAVDLVTADGARLPVLLNVDAREDEIDGRRRFEIAVIDARERRSYERQLLAERRAIERSEHRVQMLYDTVAALASARTVHDVVTAVSSHFSDSDAVCTVWLLDDNRRPHQIGSVPGEDEPPRLALPLDETGDGFDVLLAGDVIAIEDCDDDATRRRFPVLCSFLKSADQRAAMVAPLLDGANLSGVLAFSVDEPRTFEASDQQALLSLAGQTEHALRRTRLAVAEERGRRRLESLLDFTTMLAEALTPDEVAEMLNRAGSELLGAANSRTAVIDHDAQTVQFTRGVGLDDFDTTSVPLSAAAIGCHAIRTAMITIAADAERLVGDYPESPILSESVRGRVIAIPLLDAGEAVAAWVLGFDTPGEPDDDELTVLRVFAEQAGNAMRRARAHERFRRVALTLQRSLLPGDPPDRSGWSIEACYLPASDDLVVGGDLFDVTDLDDGRRFVIVGDVVGHGVGAAAAMGQLRSAAKATALRLGNPSAVLAGLDEFARLVDGALYASICCVALAPDGTGVHASAGHPYPVVVSGSGEVSVLRGGRAPLLGLARGRTLVEESFQIEPGGSLLLYTDGLIERPGEDLEVGLDRFVGHLRDERGLVPSSAEAVAAAMVGGREVRDDVVIVAATRSAT